MKQYCFIFIGRSGCGKGTQAKLVMEDLKRLYPKEDILYIQTGQELREFIKGPSHTQHIAKDIYDSGSLMPEFLAVYAWLKCLVEKFNGKEHLIFDGTPRKLHEAGVLNSIFSAYKFNHKPYIININISREEAERRLLLRKRQDDDVEEIKKRLAWYETEVVPAINYYRDNPNYEFLEIDGERAIEDIHKDIVQKAGLQ